MDHKLDEKAELEALLTEQAGRKVVIQESAKGDKGKYLQLAQINAKAALATQQTIFPNARTLSSAL